MESPNAKGQSHLIVGLFVFVSLIVAGGFIIFMGGTGLFSSEMKLGTIFKDARGLNIGAPVYVSGVDVGRVLSKDLPPDGSKGVLVRYSVDGNYKDRVRSTSVVSISSAGMLGDKTLVIFEGEGGNQLKSGDVLMAKDESDLEGFIAQGGQAIANVKEITDSLALMFKDGKTSKKIDKILSNLEAASDNLRKNTEGNWGAKIEHTLDRLDSVMTKVDKGQGTLGALVNDSSLHEDLRVLLGGAKRSKIVRFLVKQAIQNSDQKGGSDQAAPKAQQ
jgi:phospholipid/cholesterol/gamma-HCH transport system substrate-binding protein